MEPGIGSTVGTSSKVRRSLWWGCQLSGKPSQQGVEPHLLSTAQASRIMKLFLVSRPAFHRMTNYVSVPDLCLKLLCGPGLSCGEALQTLQNVDNFLPQAHRKQLVSCQWKAASEREEQKHWSEDGQLRAITVLHFPRHITAVHNKAGLRKWHKVLKTTETFRTFLRMY